MLDTIILFYFLKNEKSYTTLYGKIPVSTELLGVVMGQTERIELRLDLDLLNDIDRWRAEQRDLPSRSSSVRRLIENGLDFESNRQTFSVMRCNILIAASQAALVSDSNAFAWSKLVYPANDFHQDALAEPFERFFRVRKQMVVDIANHLDQIWLSGRTITFYALEDYFALSRGHNNLDRARLLDALRYFFLTGLFDKNFWDGVLEPGQYPIEASALTAEFERNQEIFLG